MQKKIGDKTGSYLTGLILLEMLWLNSNLLIFVFNWRPDLKDFLFAQKLSDYTNINKWKESYRIFAT